MCLVWSEVGLLDFFSMVFELTDVPIGAVHSIYSLQEKDLPVVHRETVLNMPAMDMNATSATTLSSPVCALYPQPRLLPFVSDVHLSVILPTVVYIISSVFFHLLDTYHLFEKYKIHPSEDELKRNHVTRWDCLKQVTAYHVMQIAIGLALSVGEGPVLIGDEVCRLFEWAVTVRHARALIPMVLATVGIDFEGLAGAIKGVSEGFAHVLSPDVYSTGPGAFQEPGFTPLDMFLARAIFYVGIPALQYLTALAIVDTWIYFTHRLCHINKTLYRIVHARHHLLYVSFAYGAVYAHPLESFFLDILSFILANTLAQLSPRQSMIFGSFAVFKTISDHCGYVFPYDPFLLINGNGAMFHDLHHQTWGLKNNFSTYTTFWDRLCGTRFSGEERARKNYERVWAATKRRTVGGKGEGPVMDRADERKVVEGKDL